MTYSKKEEWELNVMTYSKKEEWELNVMTYSKERGVETKCNDLQ